MVVSKEAYLMWYGTRGKRRCHNGVGTRARRVRYAVVVDDGRGHELEAANDGRRARC